MQIKIFYVVKSYIFKLKKAKHSKSNFYIYIYIVGFMLQKQSRSLIKSLN